MKATGPTAPLIVFVGAMIFVTGLLDVIDPKRLDHQQRFFLTLAVSTVAMVIVDFLTDYPEDEP